ncbi:phosphate ABC transporter permease subunit PstC [Candidatus Bipolaricaulota bacterium]|nr:phosphate ABC transporter permease subunit PstC [Candidatus Bipolaricaulota bacterium]
MTNKQTSLFRRKLHERTIKYFFFACAATSIVVLFFIAIFLFHEGVGVFRVVEITDFLSGRRWAPARVQPILGILPMLLGSLFVTIGAMIIAVPLGLSAAIYIAEIAPPKIKNPIKSAIELLAGIPSVVYGFIGLVFLVPWLQETFNLPTGFTALTGSLLLGVMAVPIIASISEDAIYAVPRDFREASYALGATKWQTITRAVLPASISGISAAIILGGMSRVIGETMTVLMVTGNAPIIPDSICSFLRPVRTMTASLALEMGEAAKGGIHYSALFAIGLVLFTITFLLNLIADFILHRYKEAQKR